MNTNPKNTTNTMQKRKFPTIMEKQIDALNAVLEGTLSQWDGTVMNIPTRAIRKNDGIAFIPENFEGIGNNPYMYVNALGQLPPIATIYSILSTFKDEAPDAFSPTKKSNNDATFEDLLIALASVKLTTIVAQTPPANPITKDSIVIVRNDDNTITLFNPYAQPIRINIDQTGIKTINAFVRMDNHFHAIGLPIRRPIAKVEGRKINDALRHKPTVHSEKTRLTAQQGILYIEFHVDECRIAYPIGNATNREQDFYLTNNIESIIENVDYFSLSIIENDATSAIVSRDQNNDSTPQTLIDFAPQKNKRRVEIELTSKRAIEIQKSLQAAMEIALINPKIPSMGAVLITPDIPCTTLRFHAYGRTVFMSTKSNTQNDENAPSFFAPRKVLSRAFGRNNRISRFAICDNELELYAQNGIRVTLPIHNPTVHHYPQIQKTTFQLLNATSKQCLPDECCDSDAKKIQKALNTLKNPNPRFFHCKFLHPYVPQKTTAFQIQLPNHDSVILLTIVENR